MYHITERVRNDPLKLNISMNTTKIHSDSLMFFSGRVENKKQQVPRPLQQSAAISPQKHSILLPLVAALEHFFKPFAVSFKKKMFSQ